MGCTCSKVQNEEGISRCRSRKRVVKKALKWRNQYAAAHSQYIIALANLGVAFRQFTGGEFRDHISSSSATSSSTSTPIPRTPTTPPTSSVVEEIVSRVKLPPMAVKSNPPSSISVVVSPPRTPKGSYRNKHHSQDDEYRRYLEADAPPEGLYTYIKQPNHRNSSPPPEPSSSYGYSSYLSSDPYAASSSYSSMPPEPPSWDIFGIFHFPPTMEFYNGGIAAEEDDHERERERERNTRRVIEEEDIPALEVNTPDRDHRHRRKPQEEKSRHREIREEKEEEIQEVRHHREEAEERRHHREDAEERRHHRDDRRHSEEREERHPEERRHRVEERYPDERRYPEERRHRVEERYPDDRSDERRHHEERYPDEGRHLDERKRHEEEIYPEESRHHPEERMHHEDRYQGHPEEGKHHEERYPEERRHHEPEERRHREEIRPEEIYHEMRHPDVHEVREPERRHEQEREKEPEHHHKRDEYEIQEEDHGRRDKKKSVVLEELEDEDEVVLPKDIPSSSRSIFNEIVEEDMKPEPPKAAYHEEKRPPPLTRKDMEVWEVLRVIEEQFQKASRTDADVSRLLEARRAHYNSSFSESGFSKRSARILKAAVSRSSQWSSPRTPLSWNASEDSSSEETREEGNGGSTLDRLYAWEKKLYTEVKENDMISVDYERKCKKLKKLDSRGASNEVIDKITVSIKVLETQMQVSMHAMKSTSKAIQDLTDKSMYPQLLELLDGYLVMWKSMSLCHEKQRLAAARMKQGRPTALEATSNSHRQATIQLEHALNQWHRSLDSLTTKHREYMRNLTSWLRLSTYTPDKDKKVERPPPVLNLCNTWLATLEGLPNGEAVQGIKNFAEAIRNLARLQAEEGKIQKKAEVSAKELSRKAQALHNLEKKLFSSSSTSSSSTSTTMNTKTTRHSTTTTSSADKSSSSPSREHSSPDPVQDSLIEKRVALELFKKRVEEEKENFSRAMQDTRKSTLECLENGLPPLFTSFSEYAECCSRAYQELQRRVRHKE